MEALTERWKKEPSGAHGCKESVWTPCPMADDGIDESRNTKRVEQVTDKAGASNHRARCDSGAGVSKSELEDPDSEERDTGRLVRFRGILQEEPVVADEAVAVAEHEGKADGVKQNAAETCVYDAFHQNVYGFPRTAKAGFQHCETHLHAENKKRGNQRPSGVDRIHDVGRLHRAIGREDLGKEKTTDSCHDEKRDADARQFAGEQSPAIAPPLRFTKTCCQARDLL